MQRRDFFAGSLVFAAACGPRGAGDSHVPSPRPPAGVGRPGIVIHGGAGTIARDMPEPTKTAYLEGLRAALKTGVEMLRRHASSLDTVETVIRVLEDNPRFNAGKGAVYTHEGKHELDAAIMDGRTLGCGTITGVKSVRNPISLARMVMEKTRHVMFAGAGAEAFADTMKVERVDATYFDTQVRYEAWQRALQREAQGHATEDAKKGTVGAVALDGQGNLAAATSTGGMTNKMFGRVGDVPIIGAGTYANNRTCAISCTGTGEEFIRHTVARDIAAIMEYKELSLQAAAEEVVHRKLAPGDGGVIGVARDGSLAMVFNSAGMYRGAGDLEGRLDVAIWE
ncbi:MAG: isoaspartyl peptidase/L-asparaginase [Nannocystaceae bacterium]